MPRDSKEARSAPAVPVLNVKPDIEEEVQDLDEALEVIPYIVAAARLYLSGKPLAWRYICVHDTHHRCRPVLFLPGAARS
jgi:hypothetical protein